MQIDVEPSAVIEKDTDSRGRLTLGTEYADETVTVLVLDE